MQVHIKEVTSIGHNKYRVLLQDIPLGLEGAHANALRRTMRGYIPGFAICSVSLPHALHPYQRMDYLQEDNLRLLLNLKQVRLHLPYGKDVIGESQVFHYKFQGPTKVTAASLACEGLHIFNPHQHICHILRAIEVDIEICVEFNLGCKTHPTHKRDGHLAVMSLFNPLKTVFARSLEGAVEIICESHGPVDAQYLVNLALHKYYSGLSLASKYIKLEMHSFFSQKIEEEEGEEEVQQESEDINISQLHLTTRIYNCLHIQGINTVRELLCYSYEDLLSLPNMGHNSLRKLTSQLELKGYKLLSKKKK